MAVGATYPAQFRDLPSGRIRLDGEMTFTDATNEPTTVTEVTLTNAQIKALITPATLVTQPDVNHVAVVTSIGIVLDCTHGVYVDPDGSAHGLSVGYPGVVTAGSRVMTQEVTNFDVDDASLGVGTGLFPSWTAIVGNGFGVMFAGAWTTGDVILAKVGSGNLTGGGAGNTLKISVEWHSSPIT